MSKFVDAVGQRQSDIDRKPTYPSLSERLGDGEKMVQVRILESELEFLQSFLEATGLSRPQVFRAAIHALRDPEVAGRIAAEIPTLPARPTPRRVPTDPEAMAAKAADWAKSLKEEKK